MKFNIKPIKNLLLTILMVAVCTLAQAQGDPGDGGPVGPPDDSTDPTAIPVDGGASLLVAVGIGYGLKKYRDGRKANSEKEQE